MSFVDDHLMSGEKVMYRARLSRAIFILPALPGLLMLSGAVAMTFTGPSAFLPMLIVALALFIWPVAVYVRYVTSEFAVTNKRVLIKVGFIRRESLETLLQKIEGIHVEEGVLGRIFNFGSIVIRGTGGTSNPFETIHDPFEFRKQVQEQVERSMGNQPSSTAISKKFCPHCGNAIDEGAKFCGKCGRPV